MKIHVFFSSVGGFYKYRDNNKASPIVWKARDFNDLNDESLAGDSGDLLRSSPILWRPSPVSSTWI